VQTIDLKTEANRLIYQLQSNQKEINLLLISVADEQDWQPDPGEWSFRHIAAHMATVENDCYRDRVMRIAAGDKPHYESYFNTGWDFGQRDLRDSLHEWVVTRQEIIDYVSALPEKKLVRTGTHDAFGTITILDVLRTMTEHDQEHLQDLQKIITVYRKKKTI
jgi:hypothetical protein